MTAPLDEDFSEYDVAINDIGFMYAISTQNPMIRETVPYTKERLDQAEDAGEQTLSAWWVKSQESFHGGAGQLNLEPSAETPISHYRYLISKGVDPFTPGKLKPLPATNLVTTDNTATDLVSVQHTLGLDEWLCYISTFGGSTHVFGLTTSGWGGNLTFSGYTGTAQSLASDGANLYIATQETGGGTSPTPIHIYRYDPNSPSSGTEIANMAIPPIGISREPMIAWQKSRLMLAFGPQIYEVDVSVSTPTTLSSTQLRYQHPVATFQWRCFASSPVSLLVAGDAGGESIITSFSIENVSGTPTLTVEGDIANLPVGEHVLSMLGVQGSFLAIGTDRGVRIGTFDTYNGALSIGPLTLDATQPTIACNALVSRDRFVYAFGQSYDEAGAITLDLGTQVDQAGRYAWAPGIIGPVQATGAVANSAVLLNRTNELAYAVNDATHGGVFMEAVSGSSARTCWLTTSHIRFGTTEPKIFKRLRVKGESSAPTDIVEVYVQTELTSPTFLTYPSHMYAGYPVGVSADNVEVELPDLAPAEWLTVTLQLFGTADCTVTSYGLKALPATPRELHIQLPLQCFDSEQSRTDVQVRDQLSSRERLNTLETLSSTGEVALLREFTPNGPVSTNVVIEKTSFAETGRPSRTSDIGGTLIVLVRTLE